MTKPRKTKPKLIAQTLLAAANHFKVSVRTVSTWKGEGGEEAGFQKDGTVRLAELRAWRALRKHRRANPTGKERDLFDEKVRKLRIANDQLEASLISREFMHNACKRGYDELASKVEERVIAAAARFPAETQEHVESHRTVLREIWTEILSNFQELVDEFK